MNTIRTFKLTILFCLFLLVATPISQGAGDGGYAAPFLQLGLSARAGAMGGAFTAVADDGSANFWNAAATAWLKKRQFSATYRKMFLDRNTGYVNILFPVRDEAAVGVGWRFAGVTDVVGRDDRGEITGDIQDFENQFAVNFARQFTRALALGVNIKYLQQNLANINAFSVGFDLGIHLIPNRDLKIGNTVIYMRSARFGFMVENIGSKYPWNSTKYYSQFGQLGSSLTDNIPVNFRTGMSYKFKRTPLILAFDLEKNTEQSAHWHLGAEYQLFEPIALRAGLRDLDISLGAGFSHPMGKTRLGIDYAFVKSPVAGADPDHLLTLQIAF